MAQLGAPLPPSATGAAWGPPHTPVPMLPPSPPPCPQAPRGAGVAACGGRWARLPPARQRREAGRAAIASQHLLPWVPLAEEPRCCRAGGRVPPSPSQPPPGPAAPRLPPSPPLLCDESRLAELSAEHGAAEPPRPAAALLDRHPLQQYVPWAGGAGRARGGGSPPYLLGDAAWRWGRVLRRRCGARGGQGAGDAGGGRAPPSPSILHAMAALTGVGAGDLCPLRGAARVGWVAVALVWRGAWVPERSDSSFSPRGAWGPHGVLGDGGAAGSVPVLLWPRDFSCPPAVILAGTVLRALWKSGPMVLGPEGWQLGGAAAALGVRIPPSPVDGQLGRGAGRSSPPWCRSRGTWRRLAGLAASEGAWGMGRRWGARSQGPCCLFWGALSRLGVPVGGFQGVNSHWGVCREAAGHGARHLWGRFVWGTGMGMCRRGARLPS